MISSGYIGEDFAPCVPGEVDVWRQMDLAAFLSPVEELVSATWSCISLPKYVFDPEAATRLTTSGLVQNISPNQLITATYTKMGGFIPGARYQLIADVVTNQGERAKFWSFLSCFANPGA